jgi:hypothetical protein
MNVTVFGATGQIGRLVVGDLLVGGHRNSRLATVTRELSDESRMTTAVTQSDRDWTIARITRPTGGRPKGTVRAGFLGRDKVGSVMSRADIAAFLISQLTDTTFSRAAPAISK